MVAFGGRGTLMGPLVGALILAPVPFMLQQYDTLKDVIYGALIIAVVVLMPGGICGALLNGVMARQRSRDRSAGLADIGDNRDTAFDMIEREFEERLALGNGEADRFASMHRQRQPLRAAGEVKIEHIAVAGQIDAAAYEWRNGCVHQAEFKITHLIHPFVAAFVTSRAVRNPKCPAPQVVAR